MCATKAETANTISFNGGPGTAFAWMHIGCNPPVLLNIDDEGLSGASLYGYKENP